SLRCSPPVDICDVNSKKNSGNRTKSLNPISCVTPLALDAPCPGDHANQPKKWDREGKKNCALPKRIRPNGWALPPLSRISHARAPSFRVASPEVCLGAAA